MFVCLIIHLTIVLDTSINLVSKKILEQCYIHFKEKLSLKIVNQKNDQVVAYSASGNEFPPVTFLQIFAFPSDHLVNSNPGHSPIQTVY